MSEKPSMDHVDHGAGACCGQCGGAAPKPRLQPRVAGDGVAQGGPLGDVAAIGAAKFLPQLYLGKGAHIGRHLGQIAHALQDSVE